MKFFTALFFFIAFSCSGIAQMRHLDFFIQQAITESPLIKEYRDQVSQLALDSQMIRAALRPQVVGTSTNSYAPVIGGWGYDKVLTNGQQVSGVINVSKEMFTSRITEAQQTGINLQMETLDNTMKISEQDLRRLIIDQYIVVYGGQLQLEFYRHINQLLQKEDTLLRKLTQDNVYRQTDYLSFAVLLQQQLLTTSQLAVQNNYDLATLNYLAGIVDTTAAILQDPGLKVRSSPVLPNSIFYHQFILDSLKLKNDRRLIDLSYRPRVNVYADAGYNSSFEYKPYKNFGTSVGINITVPIYDGKQKKLQYAKLDLQERTRITKRDFFSKQHDQQLLQLEQQLSSINQLTDQMSKQVVYTETLVTVNEKLLATGDIRLTDFILSLNNYFTAKYLVTQNYISRLKIINQLNYWDK